MDMTQSPLPTDVPRWTVGDRLGKALHHAGIGVGDMADYLGLSRNSVSAYINDLQTPKRQTLLLWAMRTGVALEWLENGADTTSAPPPDRPRGTTPELERLARQKRNRVGARTTQGYSAGSPIAA